jgi:hypothetical protein
MFADFIEKRKKVTVGASVRMFPSSFTRFEKHGYPITPAARGR